MRSQAIWHPAALAVQIRQELVLSGTVNGGVLRCAGSGPYVIYLNGELVGRGLGEGARARARLEEGARTRARRSVSRPPQQ